MMTVKDVIEKLITIENGGGDLPIVVPNSSQGDIFDEIERVETGYWNQGNLCMVRGINDIIGDESVIKVVRVI